MTADQAIEPRCALVWARSDATLHRSVTWSTLSRSTGVGPIPREVFLEKRTTTDEALMVAIAQGDQEALARLIAAHGRGVWGFAAGFLGDEDEAEDVAQEVFVRAWQHAGRYDPTKAPVSTWLYRVARNLCIDRHRRRAVRRFVGLEQVEAVLEDDRPSPERVEMGRWRLDATRREIDDLPEKQRTALLLLVVNGLDTVQIARIMDASRGAVEQFLVRGRRRLRARLGNLLAEERYEKTAENDG